MRLVKITNQVMLLIGRAAHRDAQRANEASTQRESGPEPDLRSEPSTRIAPAPERTSACA